MNSMTVSGGTTASVDLLGSAIGKICLSQSSAHPVSSLSSANTPLMDVAPTVKELSDSETLKSTQLADVSDSTTVEPEYTLKECECAFPEYVAIEEDSMLSQSDDDFFPEKIEDINIDFLPSLEFDSFFDFKEKDFDSFFDFKEKDFDHEFKNFEF